MKRVPNVTGEQLASGMRDFAVNHGRIPTLLELQGTVTQQTGKGISNGSLYALFASHAKEDGGRGGVGDFARAHGILAAVIVDGIVYTEADGTIENPIIQHVVPPDSVVVEEPTNSLETMPTAELIGLLGNVATILEQRKDQFAALDALTRQIMGSSATIQST